MNIVFLDASTLHHGDLDLSPIEELGSLTCHATTEPAQTLARSQTADILITNKVVLSRAVLDACPDLRLIVVAATGTNCVDLDAARDRGLPVCNVSAYSTASVAQHAIGMLINLASNIHRFDRVVRSAWPESPIFTRLDYPVVELAGKVLGIVGYGAIGQAVGRVATALDMEIVALARPGQASTSGGPIPRLATGEFFRHADAVTLHCPLTPQTQQFINGEILTLMKQSAFLINTGRGALIDEPALAEALRCGDIAGAALDVLSTEPPAASHPLLAEDIPNLLITPHTAWTSLEARHRLLAGIRSNILAFLAGHPANRVA
jgi:glycerate dehydrogenase